jgi:hypothetical protein
MAASVQACCDDPLNQPGTLPPGWIDSTVPGA